MLFHILYRNFILQHYTKLIVTLQYVFMICYILWIKVHNTVTLYLMDSITSNLVLHFEYLMVFRFSAWAYMSFFAAAVSASMPQNWFSYLHLSPVFYKHKDMLIDIAIECKNTAILLLKKCSIYDKSVYFAANIYFFWRNIV